MICKLTYNGQNKVCRLKENGKMEDIRALISKYYPNITSSYELYYLDETEDCISLSNDDDLEIFKEIARPNLKIHIKTDGEHPLDH
jgi:hypothetical protein